MNTILSGERLWTFLANIFVLLCLFAVTPAYSQSKTESQKLLSLQQALKLTLEQNPSLKVFQFRQQALAGQQATAAQRPSYQLGIELENFAASGDSQAFDNSELTVSLSSAIELGDKLNARLGVVRSQRSYTEIEKELQALKLVSETTRRYIDLLSSQERVKLAQQAEQLAKETVKVVQKRADAGAANRAEVKRAKAAWYQTQITLDKEIKTQQFLRSNLSVMWTELETSFTQVAGNLYQFGQDLSFKELYSKVQQNPAIKQFAAKARLRQTELDLAKSNNLSNFNWSVGITRNQASNELGLKAGFSMDLFSDTRNQGNIKSALAAKEEVYVSKQTALLRIHTQLLQAYQYRQQSIDAVNNLNTHIIPSLERALKETKSAYQRGRYSYLDYVSARQELLSAKRQLIDTASVALHYGVTIEELTAEPLSTAEQPKTEREEASHE